jgi:DNA ligase D-like protein (predicted 3'-phosphoesterase)
MPIFVVHEHHAQRLHWDFRLEMENVLKSWALPKRPPRKSGIKRLAIQVEDHELDYASFEGEIGEGEYGAGIVKIWDKGEYKMLKHDSNYFKFELYGLLLNKTYVLYKYPQVGEHAWLLFKTKAV